MIEIVQGKVSMNKKEKERLTKNEEERCIKTEN